MSVRRRAIQQRVEKRDYLDRQFKESAAALDEIQRVIDSFRAEGLTKVTQEEFAVRLHVLRTAVSEEGKQR